MLGKALCQALQGQHVVYPFSSQNLDVTSWEAVLETFQELQPDWVVHAAAYTRVDEAESDPRAAYRVNALGTRNVAAAAHQAQSSLLYYSTDYVFDGKLGKPYREWDLPNPLNEYGRSKLAGEFFVRSLSPTHLIVRTSWLFGPLGDHSPPDFIGKILERSRTQPHLNVVADQRGSPTFAPDLAEMTLRLLARTARGTYHVTNSEDCTWHEYAREIVSLRGVDVEIHPSHSDPQATLAARPSSSVLDNYVLKLETIPLLRPWKEALSEFLGV